MPGKFVFPGGRVEPQDARMAFATPLDPHVEARLSQRVTRPRRDLPRALALAAIRETFEETGLLLGTRTDRAPAVPGDHWAAFAEARVLPDLASLHFIARAITPPRRPPRLAARFFSADAGAIAHKVDGIVGPDAELVELVWMPISEAKQFDMPTITRIVLEQLELRVARGFGQELPSPFFRMLNKRFVLAQLAG